MCACMSLTDGGFKRRVVDRYRNAYVNRYVLQRARLSMCRMERFDKIRKCVDLFVRQRACTDTVVNVRTV